MLPWISELAGCKIINFMFYQNNTGRLVERNYGNERCLTLFINEMVFVDAVLAVIEKSLWLSINLDPHYKDRKIEIVRKVRLDDAGKSHYKPIIPLPLGNYLVEISYTISSLCVSFPVSKFVEGATDYLEKNPVFNLANDILQGEKLRKKWQEMLESLDRVNPDTEVGL